MPHLALAQAQPDEALDPEHLHTAEQILARLAVAGGSQDAVAWATAHTDLVTHFESVLEPALVGPLRDDTAIDARLSIGTADGATRLQQHRCLALLWLGHLGRRLSAWPQTIPTPSAREEVVDLLTALGCLQSWPTRLLTPHLLVAVLEEMEVADRRTAIMAHWPATPREPLVASVEHPRGPMWALRTRVLFQELPRHDTGWALLGWPAGTSPDTLGPWLSHAHREVRMLGLRAAAALGATSPIAPDRPPSARASV